MEYIPKLIPHLMLFSLSSSKICTVHFHSNDNSLVSDYGHILVCLKLTNSCDLSYVKYSVPRDKMNCLVRFGNCFLRVALMYQPSCLLPCCQGKPRELAKIFYPNLRNSPFCVLIFQLIVSKTFYPVCVSLIKTTHPKRAQAPSPSIFLHQSPINQRPRC